jgi:hypothetical protein
MNPNSARIRFGVAAAVIALAVAPLAAKAATLPAFAAGIEPIGASVTIKSQTITTMTSSNTTVTGSGSFVLNTGYNSTDFVENLIDLIGTTAGTFTLGVAQSQGPGCQTGEPILSSVTIPMLTVTHSTGPGTDQDNFQFLNPPTLDANWTTMPFQGGSSSSSGNTGIVCIDGQCTTTSGGGSSSISCINNQCVTGTGGGTTIITCINGTCTSSGGSPPPTPPADQLSFDASSETPGTISTPNTPLHSAVDVFIVYTDADDPSGSPEGGCTTVHTALKNSSTATQTKIVNGKKTSIQTVTGTFGAQ